MKYVKKVIAVVVLFVFCFISVPSVNAAEISKGCNPCQVRITNISAKCDCGRSNINYGVDPMFTGGTYTYDEGELCEYCNKIVPINERHISTYWRDKYFFACSSCGKFYTRYGSPYVTEHDIRNYN